MMDDSQIQVEPPKREYGDMKVLFRRGTFVLTLGPDYCFFICAFTFFSIAAFAVLTKALSMSDSPILKTLAFIACIGQPCSYLLTAFSNPGIVTSQPNIDLDKSKFCKICRYNVPKSTYHCTECDVCILEYDHHCPWVSKCVGKYNLRAFYLFVCMTPLFFLVTMLCFVVPQ